MFKVNIEADSATLNSQYKAICAAEKANGSAPNYTAAKEAIEEELAYREVDEIHQQWLNEYFAEQAKANKSESAVGFRGYFMRRQASKKEVA